MPAKNPRINLVLEEPLFRAVRSLADAEGVSLSFKARDLIRDGLEAYEDEALARFAEGREATMEGAKALDHSEVW
jgi:hypothetical protein